ncbi:hypothetical protein J8V57_09635 [Xenorhabdus sp. PB61.4]|uniref:DUF2829 domain-containing protein n=1 Tax=Xenorhabdus sp. PB61.4 TaxID=2788940 RepID=UPI001E3E8815|nr:DUF2829 domain-containing protein [Xenorhabdus sp. PB61.4]MCC8366541.1 hypothetical protein [Xenorhabdus sp. PB61.4]
MSDVNKPKQYDNGDAIVMAGPGSFAWALGQMLSGGKIYRVGWILPKEVMYLNHGTKQPFIEKRNKDGSLSPWKPSQKELYENMMALDWKTECMLSFDLNIAIGNFGNGEKWGYIAKGFNSGYDQPTFGTLTNFQNTLGIGNVISFMYMVLASDIGIELRVDTQNQSDLVNKNLEVRVNGSTYNLGIGSNEISITDFLYKSDDVQRLGELMKQSVGKTLHFCFNWQ